MQEQLRKELSDLQAMLGAGHGELGHARFKPHEPESIESAIWQLNDPIERRINGFTLSPTSAAIVASIKKKYRRCPISGTTLIAS